MLPSRPGAKLVPARAGRLRRRRDTFALGMLMQIERLSAEDASADLAAAVNRLLPQLSPNAPRISHERLEELLQTPCVQVFAARGDGALAGMLTLIVAPIPTGFHGYIEDVVVDEAFRGQGIAERLVRAALDAARDAGADTVDLTSNAAREAANRLYVRIGFERRDTNAYRFRLR